PSSSVNESSAFPAPHAHRPTTAIPLHTSASFVMSLSLRQRFSVRLKRQLYQVAGSELRAAAPRPQCGPGQRHARARPWVSEHSNQPPVDMDRCGSGETRACVGEGLLGGGAIREETD